MTKKHQPIQLKEALDLYEQHHTNLKSRSDKRALWMNCVGVSLCKEKSRINSALIRLQEWANSQPIRKPLWEKWEKMLLNKQDLKTVLENTEDNQELRSVSPLCASIQPIEHKMALTFFQKSINPKP